MIHLLPLPGRARYTKGGMPLIVNTALRDLEALETGGLTQRSCKISGMSPLPTFVGSGVRIDNLSTCREADRFTVETSLKGNGKIDSSIDPTRVRALFETIAELGKGK